MLKTMRFLVLMLSLFVIQLFSQPIKVHPSNPHYFLFNGQPTVLITSAEHYGGVMNKAFDYVKYFDALKEYGLNYTRIYPGVLFEPMGKFVPGNTLGPKVADLLVPWARSAVPGANPAGNKFDLDKWDTAYFQRLKDFIQKAGERDIVVEICFFNMQYSDTWPISPLFHENNIQGVGKCGYLDAQTLNFPDVVKRMEDYVSKLTIEVNPFDNVILEICDEPNFTGPPVDSAATWVKRMLAVAKETDSKLPKKHLIAQQVMEPIGGPIDLSAHPDVSLIVTQYVWSGGRQVGGMLGLDSLYHHNKPIEDNETDYYPIWYRGNKIADSRVEAWEFMVGGGAGFNQLNGLYTVEDPAGKTEENGQLLQALKNLKDFLYSFDFIKMSQDKGLVISGLPTTAHWRAISQPGKQYALYIHHGFWDKGGAYEVNPGNFTENPIINLPAGTYSAAWVNPETGTILKSEEISHNGGNLTLSTPTYTVDIALRVKATK